MSVIVYLKDRQAGQPIISADDDAEFLQIVNLLSGVSTNKELLVKLSDSALAPLNADQVNLATGPIALFKRNNSDAIKFLNGGKIHVLAGNNPAAVTSSFNTLGGLYHTNKVDAANNLAAETDLHSKTLENNMFGEDGDTVYFKQFGTNAANANGKTLQFYFNGVSYLGVNGNFNGVDYILDGWITRIDSDSVKICIRVDVEGVTTPFIAVVQVDSLTFSNSIVIKTTGQGSSTNDIIAKVTNIHKYSAAPSVV